MTNSSSLCNAALAAGIARAASFLALAAPALAPTLVPMALTTALLAVLDAAARGQLDARLVGGSEGGSLGRLKHGVNRLLDLTEAFTKEADAAMEKCAEGLYFRHILTDGLVGDFSRHARLINEALAGMQEKSRGFATEAAAVGRSVRAGARAVAVTGRTWRAPPAG